MFLDLKQDAYTLVDGPAAEALRSLGSGDCVETASETSSELVTNGLLTTSKELGRQILPTAVPLVMKHLTAGRERARMRLDVGHVLRFIVACTKAAISLHCRRFETTIATVARRKAKTQRDAVPSVEQLRELVTIFDRLRLFFPKNYLCLYDSLALIEFLALYRIFPDWVFGVQLEPWAAHCWVQDAEFVFNESVEQAGNYTPVMCV